MIFARTAYGRHTTSRRVRVSSQASGDVAARVVVRFGELTERYGFAARWSKTFTAAISGAPFRTQADVLGVGVIEGWRGPVLIALETGLSGSIRRCHPHDPSRQNWPLIEYAILGTWYLISL